MVVIADNSGAKKGKIFRIYKGSSARRAQVGDRVMIAIKESTPGSSVKKGDVSQAIIVRVRKEIKRNDGTYIRFSDNAVALVTKNEKGEIAPVGKRIFGPVARELRNLGYRNLTNMAEEVI